MFMHFDPLYWMLMIPAMLAAMGATVLVKGTFAHYARRHARSGVTGAQAARTVLARSGIRDVEIVPGTGFLSDLYDPLHKVIRLSPDVYASSSLSAIGVACHEAGHAVQHARGFFPLHLRNTMVPVVQFSTSLSWIMIFGGMILRSMQLAQLGVLLFGFLVFYQIITLPVELDASRRALALMTENELVTREEKSGARWVLSAAALTYVAAAFTAVMQLLYFMMRTGMLGGRRDER
ncbi:MAG: zinc metallopeptidase [Acidobacteriota bacterium]